MIREVFPTAQFGWTQSGQDKLRLAAERGIEFPPALRESLETLPPLLEGRFEGDGIFVEFFLGHEEPVKCLYVSPRINSPSLDQKFSELETKVGGTFVISGEETNRPTSPEN